MEVCKNEVPDAMAAIPEGDSYAKYKTLQGQLEFLELQVMRHTRAPPGLRSPVPSHSTPFYPACARPTHRLAFPSLRP